MNPTLKTFYENQNERETVKLFLIETLKGIAVERAFNGQDTYGIQEANEAIIKMFDKLDEIYGKIKPPVIGNSR